MTSFLLLASLWTPAAEASPERRHEVAFRIRAMGAPKAILDTWYTDEDEAIEDGEEWPAADPRPAIKGYALGLDYTLKNKVMNATFYGEYFDATMKHGYFDDRDEDLGAGQNDYYSGRYLEPSKGLGFVGFGANFGYDVRIVRGEQTNDIFALSFLPGAGLGLMVVTGHMDEWKPDPQVVGAPSNPQTSAVGKYERGLPADTELGIPPVLPLIDINLTLRMTFANRFVLRLEGGVHNLFYAGAAAGVTF